MRYTGLFIHTVFVLQFVAIAAKKNAKSSFYMPHLNKEEANSFVKFLVNVENETTTEKAENVMTESLQTISPEVEMTSTFVTTLEYFNETLTDYESTPIPLENITAEVDIIAKSNENTTNIHQFDYLPSFINGFSAYCSCDWTVAACDINCCCDPLCTPSQRALFKHCDDKIEEKKRKKLEFCRNRVFYFKNNTRYTLEEDSNSLLCIVKTNLPPIDIDIKVIKSASEFDQWMSGINTWRSLNTNMLGSKEFSNKTAYIQMCFNGTPVPLTITGRALVRSSRLRQPVKLYENIQRENFAKIIETEMIHVLELLNSNVTIVGNLTFVGQYCSSEKSLIDITAIVCNSDICKPLNMSEHYPSCDDTQCTNIANEVEYKFYLNDTHIQKAVVKMHLTNMKSHEMILAEKIAVDFTFSNSTWGEPIKLSGHPGFERLKPVITSQFITLGNGTSVEDFALPNNYRLRNIMAIPKNVDFQCVRNNLTYAPILFNENVKTSCSFKINFNKYEKNVTELCEKLQREVFRMMGFDPRAERFISPYGNPFYSSARIPLLYKMASQVDGVDDEDGLKCYNFVTQVFYKFVYGLDSNNYFYIKGAVVETTKTTTLCINTTDYIFIEILTYWKKTGVGDMSGLFSRTGRHEVWESKSPPSFGEIFSLPKDFFHPFYNSGVRFTEDLNSRIFVLFFLIVFLC